MWPIILLRPAKWSVLARTLSVEHSRLAIIAFMTRLLRRTEASANGILRSHQRRLPACDSTGTVEWDIAGAKAQLLAAGRGTIAGIGTTAAQAVGRLTYHALLAGLQALLAEDYVGALTIAAAPAFIALLRPGDHAQDPDLKRLRRQAIQLLNQVRSELTLHEQVVVPPLFVETIELARRAAKPLPPRVIAFVTQLNTNPSAVTHEDLNRLQIRGTDTYSRIRLPELLPLVEPAIVAEAQAAFPDAPASQAVVLRWHLRGLMLPLALRKAAPCAESAACKTTRSNLV
jgi:hypothetical protein